MLAHWWEHCIILLLLRYYLLEIIGIFPFPLCPSVLEPDLDLKQKKQIVNHMQYKLGPFTQCVKKNIQFGSRWLPLQKKTLASVQSEWLSERLLYIDNRHLLIWFPHQGGKHQAKFNSQYITWHSLPRLIIFVVDNNFSSSLSFSSEQHLCHRHHHHHDHPTATTRMK